MASAPGNKRPNPAQEQLDAMNRAVNRGAVTNAATIPAAPASLDTFNVTRAPSAAEAAAAAVTLDREDDGLNHHGESSQDNGGAQDLNDNESDLANEKASELWESVVADEEEDESGYGDDTETGSPFDFVNPGRERLAQHMEDIFPEEDQPSGGGTAAGRTAPTTSAGGSPFGNTGGTGAYGATDPFTGQGMGLNAYGTPGIPGVGTGGSKGGANDPLFGLMTARADEMSAGETSPSVADDALNAAVKGANEAVYGKASPDPDAGKSTNAALISKGAAGMPGAHAVYWDDEKGEVVEASQVTAGAAAAAAADMKTTATTDTSKIEGSESKSDTTIFNFIAQAMDADDDYTKEQTKKAAEAQEAAKQRDAAKNSTKPGADQPGPGGEDLGGPPSESEIAFRNYLRQATNYHGSPGHNEGDSTPTPEGNAVGSGSVSITHSRDVGHAMFGQPNEDRPSMRGGTPSGAFLPGDRGDVDPGEDSDTGGWTSNAQTEQPEDALSGLGGSGLSISDARRDADDDDDDDQDDDAT